MFLNHSILLSPSLYTRSVVCSGLPLTASASVSTCKWPGRGHREGHGSVPATPICTVKATLLLLLAEGCSTVQYPYQGKLLLLRRLHRPAGLQSRKAFCLILSPAPDREKLVNCFHPAPSVALDSPELLQGVPKTRRGSEQNAAELRGCKPKEERSGPRACAKQNQAALKRPALQCGYQQRVTIRLRGDKGCWLNDDYPRWPPARPPPRSPLVTQRSCCAHQQVPVD